MARTADPVEDHTGDLDVSTKLFETGDDGSGGCRLTRYVDDKNNGQVKIGGQIG